MGSLIAAIDRLWWAEIIRRADIVDLDFVGLQTGHRSASAAIRAYVRGGHRRGLGLNPLFLERLVASQLSEADRVPALYAYLVNDVRTVHTSTSWDAPWYATHHPESLAARGGPLGHAWRAARDGVEIELGFGPRRRSIRWREVHRHLAGGLTRRARVPSVPALVGATSVAICRIGLREPDAASAIRLAVALATGEGHRTLLALADTDAGEWADALLLELWLDGTSVIRDAPDVADRVESVLPIGCLITVRGRDAEISAEELRAVARAAVASTAAPLWLDLDGSVTAAGLVSHEGRAFGLLAGHPVEDALRLAGPIVTAGAAGDTFVRPAGARRSPGVTVIDAIVRAPRSPLGGVSDWPDDDIDGILAPAGLQVRAWTDDGPLFSRVDVAGAPPARRWAIKIVAPAGRPGEAWGDTHFARGVADALRRLGQEVVIDSYSARNRPSSYLDDVILALRGPEPFEPQPGARSLVWIISHPDQVTASEIGGFDAVLAASQSWSEAATVRFGREVAPLLQCTDTTRFHPTGAARGDRLVFVGTARGIARPSVVEPIRAGMPVDVYGPDWRGYIPATAIRASGVPNRDLPELYESALAVLNDHWPAMRAEGFVSNRLYDVVAAGGRAVSDDVDGIAEVFGDAVLTYRTVPELLELLGADLDARFPDDNTLAAIAARVRADHSFDARARTLVDIVLALDERQDG